MTKDEPMSFHAPEIHTAIDAALRDRAAAPRRRLWRRSGALTFAVVLVGGTALAATTTPPWVPILGDDHRGHPAPATAPIPGDQLAPLAVLRRPQTEADRTAGVEDVLKLLPEREVGGVHTDGVRLLARRADGDTVLIPVQRTGSHDPDYPSSIRADQLCLVYGARDRDGNLGGAQLCGSADDLRAGRITGSAAGGDGRMHQVGLVPDGVAQVELTLRDGSTLLAAVKDNSYEAPFGDATMRVPEGLSANEVVVGRDKIRWLDPAGNEIATSKPNAS